MAIKMNVIYLVIPCYNEQEVINETSCRLQLKMEKLIIDKKVSPQSKIVFVDDGSKDNTWILISKLHEQSSLFQGIKLSRNKGHQNALLAGLLTVKDYCDAAISMDADLQDDIEAIDLMISEFDKGSEVVYGVRSARETDTFFKRTTAQGFYKFMKLMGADTVYNHADYRLMSKRALEGLEGYKEVNLFLRGIIPMVGFKSTTVLYKRGERFAGESKYPLKKMLSFAWEGITSLSVKPIKLITSFGSLLFCGGLIALLVILINYLCNQNITDRALFISLFTTLFGLQFLSTGIIGEYIGKIYLETKSRPRFIVETYLND